MEAILSVPETSESAEFPEESTAVAPQPSNSTHEEPLTPLQEIKKAGGISQMQEMPPGGRLYGFYALWTFGLLPKLLRSG